MDEQIRPREPGPHQFVAENGLQYWTLPSGWKHPSCGGCGRTYLQVKPQRSKGGASVIGPLCNACIKELQK